MRIALVSDAWAPQVNGVVRTLERLCEELPKLGVEVVPLTPADYRTVPCPTYPEIALSLARPATIARRLDAIAPDHVHIATEGPLGFLARRWAIRNHHRFTTSFHTRFPEYLAARFPVPEALTYAVLRRFHNAAAGCMVSTASFEAELAERGFGNLMRWSRGVDIELFRPRPELQRTLKGPVFLYVGRVSVEKNIEAFLALDLPGTKLVVGDGPARAELEARYPDAVFAGAHAGEDLARLYAAADVFVFPSLTDTFGIVLLEALASGLPVAAYPVTGPIDVIDDTGTGVLGADLRTAALGALDISGARCREYATGFTWGHSARMFLDNVMRAHNGHDAEGERAGETG
ncbi:MAG TPA: glycosyltransferase family 1 protein [Hyphomicrobiales bacterium]|nr:glycosyltransferase family 1 protein [Hyphomicrobiales bacterium]